MKNNNITLLIYVKGHTPAIEYKANDFRTFIEGRDGSDFEIEVVNNNPFRVEAIVSVDGLSVTDGKEAGDSSRGYVVEANGRVRIPGWKVDGDTAAKFTFTGRKGGSYVEQATNQATNKGVIGLMVFEEAGHVGKNWAKGLAHGGSLYGTPAFPLGGEKLKGARTFARSRSDSAHSSASASFSNAASLNWLDQERSMLVGSCSPTVSLNCVDFSESGTQAAIAQVQQALGTEFGDATEFRTTNVSFVRGDMVVMMALYYDDRKGLSKRGIEVVRPSQARYVTTPNPFPTYSGGGCQPPKDWTR